MARLGRSHDVRARPDRERQAQPTVNAYGLLYGATELSSPWVPVLDPVKNVKSQLTLPLLDRENTPSSKAANPVLASWRYFGTEAIWNSQQNSHSDAMDQDGRVWWMSQIRSPQNPPAIAARPAAARHGLLPRTRSRTIGDFTQNAR
jgi:hypothetical protein